MSSQAEATIYHFSHAHPLQLSNFQPQQDLNQAVCSGCKLKASGLMYSCKECNYFLHTKCSQMPMQITHPFDKNHAFSLLSKHAYPDGNFNCAACGKQGDGFSYHCKECGLDLDIVCAAMPLSRADLSHPHELKLTFDPPYRNKMFFCKICEGVGSDQWLYRCNLCKFDVHLDCICTPMPTQMQQNQPAIRSAPVQSQMPQSERHNSDMSSQAEAKINHFSHEHPLQLSDFQIKQDLNRAICSACKLKASGLMYSCHECNYFLHTKCSEMLMQITHPCDKNHVFSLLSKPTHCDGNFNCAACGKQGDGFSYHCKDCNLDLHILCAIMPLSRLHLSHPHELKLTFEAPYRNKMFFCQTCEGVGSNQWLYRCHLCKFDVHLDCICTPVPTQMEQNQPATRAAPVQNQMPEVPMQRAPTASRSAPQVQPPQYVAARPHLQNFRPPMSPFYQGMQGPFLPLGATQNNNTLVLQHLYASSTKSTIKKKFFEGIMEGAGEGIGNAGVSNLLQALTGGNTGGGGGGLGMLQESFGGEGFGFF